MVNVFEMLCQDDGAVWAVSLLDDDWDQEAVFTDAFLQCPHYRFLSYGDGLIVIRALEGTAVYGEIGPATEHHVSAVRARLLQVKPGMVDQALSKIEEQPDATD
jgi:hypothetical protein